MRILCDTNVLSRTVDPSQPMFQDVTSSLQRVRKMGFLTTIVPQNLYELWVVITRPKTANGLGKTVTEAHAIFQSVKSLFTLLDDTPGVFTEWENLLQLYSIQGKIAHDARLVAAMKCHGIDHILTLNVNDFSRYAGIIVFSPQQVLSLP